MAEKKYENGAIYIGKLNSDGKPDGTGTFINQYGTVYYNRTWYDGDLVVSDDGKTTQVASINPDSKTATTRAKTYMEGLGADPYAYVYNPHTKSWWAKRKNGSLSWTDLKTKLSATKYTEADTILSNRYDSNSKDKTDKDKTNDKKEKPDNTKNKTKDKKDKPEVTPDTSSLAKDYKLQKDIVFTLYDLITKNPEKYFKDFRSKFNDKEAEAAAYFKTWQTYCNTELDKIQNKNNEDISLNSMLIKNSMDAIYKSIKNNSQIKKTIRITDPTFKSTSTYTRDKGYTATFWWQYFNN